MIVEVPRSETLSRIQVRYLKHNTINMTTKFQHELECQKLTYNKHTLLQN